MQLMKIKPNPHQPQIDKVRIIHAIHCAAGGDAKSSKKKNPDIRMQVVRKKRSNVP